VVVYPQGYLYGGVVELPEETIADITRRLRRVEGQVRGIQQMLAEGRDCRDVVTQLSAANKALEQAGFVLVAAGLTWCLADPERSAAEGYDLADVQKMFTKLA
jgi:DNA-binding FrmR family transcriptional regulator